VSIKGWMTALRSDGADTSQAFDGLASGLADQTISRRRALQLAGATALGAAGLVASARPAEAAANCRGVETGNCGARSCCEGTSKQCICVRTTAGTKRCVWQCCPEGGALEGCDDNGDCPDDMLCVREGNFENCCPDVNFPDDDGVCMFRCRGFGRPDSGDCDFFGGCN
jgi:hypothetical protein